MYTVDYFINKFEAIPEGRWTTGVFVIGNKCCANGFCGLTNDKRFNEEAGALADLLMPLAEKCRGQYNDEKIFWVTANINDGFISEYNQSTPKRRILAALHDVKKMQAKELITN